jgi:hypothetical protein
MQKIRQAEKQAEELISRLDPEIVKRLGIANLLSDLTHEILLGTPIDVLEKQLNEDIMVKTDPLDFDFPIE